MIASMGHVGPLPAYQEPGQALGGQHRGHPRDLALRRRLRLLRAARRQGPGRQPADHHPARRRGRPGHPGADRAGLDDLRPQQGRVAEELDAIAAPIAEYFLRHTMAELYEMAVETNLMLAPANSPRQLIESRQLEARDFFCALRRPSAHLPRSFVHVTSPDDAVRTPGPDRAGPTRRRRAGAAGRRPSRARPGRAAPTRPGRHRRGRAPRSSSSGRARPAPSRCATSPSTAPPWCASSRGRGPDFLRTYGMGPGNPCGLEGSDMFDALNVGKLGVTLNLKHPEGVALAKRLVQWTDAVAENFAPRAMRSFGLDYALAGDREARPRHDQLVPAGPDRARTRTTPASAARGRPSAATTSSPAGPTASRWAPTGRSPTRSPRASWPPPWRPASSTGAAPARACTSTWPRSRRRCTRCQPVDRSTTTSTATSASRQGNRSDRVVPHGAFRCAGDDRWVAVACRDDDDWRRAGRGHRSRRRPRAVDWPPSRPDRRPSTRSKTLVDPGHRRTRTPTSVAATLQAAGDRGGAGGRPRATPRPTPSCTTGATSSTLDHPCMGECGYERNGFRLSRRPCRLHTHEPPPGRAQRLCAGRDPRARRRPSGPGLPSSESSSSRSGRQGGHAEGRAHWWAADKA